MFFFNICGTHKNWLSIKVGKKKNLNSKKRKSYRLHFLTTMLKKKKLASKTKEYQNNVIKAQQLRNFKTLFCVILRLETNSKLKLFIN